MVHIQAVSKYGLFGDVHVCGKSYFSPVRLWSWTNVVYFIIWCETLEYLNANRFQIIMIHMCVCDLNVFLIIPLGPLIPNHAILALYKNQSEVVVIPRFSLVVYHPMWPKLIWGFSSVVMERLWKLSSCMIKRRRNQEVFILICVYGSFTFIISTFQRFNWAFHFLRLWISFIWRRVICWACYPRTLYKSKRKTGNN